MWIFVKVAVMKKSRKPERRQRAESEKDALKNEHKEKGICKMATQLVSVARQQQRTKLTEAH